MGASMVNWIALEPCLLLSESYLYVLTLNFVKKKIIDISKSYSSTKPSN